MSWIVGNISLIKVYKAGDRIVVTEGSGIDVKHHPGRIFGRKAKQNLKVLIDHEISSRRVPSNQVSHEVLQLCYIHCDIFPFEIRRANILLFVFLKWRCPLLRSLCECGAEYGDVCTCAYAPAVSDQAEARFALPFLEVIINHFSFFHDNPPRAFFFKRLLQSGNLVHYISTWNEELLRPSIDLLHKRYISS